MRRDIHKPRRMSIRQVYERLEELNELLPWFPPHFKSSQKFEDNEISEIIEALAPQQWSGTLKVQNFDINTHSSIELVEFFERLETAEQIWHNASGQKSTASHDNGGQNTSSKQNVDSMKSRAQHSKRPSQSSRGQKRRASTNLESNPSAPCPLHGNQHSMMDCPVIG